MLLPLSRETPTNFLSPSLRLVIIFWCAEKRARKMKFPQPQWTRTKLLTMWFDNWGNNLVVLGFIPRNDDGGGINISDDQLVRILNFDETAHQLVGGGQRPYFTILICPLLVRPPPRKVQPVQ